MIIFYCKCIINLLTFNLSNMNPLHFQCYNKKNGRWKSMSPMGTKRAAPSAQLVNGNI